MKRIILTVLVFLTALSAGLPVSAEIPRGSLGYSAEDTKTVSRQKSEYNRAYWTLFSLIASSAAYAPDDGTETVYLKGHGWEFAPNRITDGKTTVHFITGKGIMADGRPLYVISFRGSADKKDWAADFVTGQVVYGGKTLEESERIAGFLPGGSKERAAVTAAAEKAGASTAPKVHKGFNSYADLTLRMLLTSGSYEFLEQFRREKDACLLLTGHSGDFLSGLVLLTGKASFLSACRQIWLCVLLLAVCLAACLLLVTMLAGTAERARKACNVLLLISLVLGGTLWPCSLLPSPFHLAGRLTMPWYMLLLLEETAADSSLSAVLADLLPVLAAGTVCLLLSILYIASSGRIRSNRQQALALANRQAVPVRQTSVFSPPPEEPGRLQSLAGRLAGLTGFKCRIAGGRAMLPLLLLLTVCSLAAGAASGQDSRALRVAVSDLDNSDISAGLTDMIREESRISLSRCSPEEGQRLLMTGSIEGLLVIDEGYGDRMRAYAETDMDQEGSGRAMPLHYYAASSAASAQGVREIAAGQVCAQRSAWRAMRIAGNLRGDPLNEAERQTLLAMIEEEKALLPALYQLHYGSGRPAGIPFLPGAEAFAAMASLMLLMTAGSFYGRRDAISASIRMQPLPGGHLLSHGSDLLSLTLTGFIYCMTALLPGLLLQAVTSGAPPVSFAAALPGRAAACFLYAFCGGALSLFLVRKSPMEGRIDAMAPVLTVLLCLTGGCFMDLTSLSRGLRFLSLLSPPGLLTGACSGSPAAFAILAAEGLLLSLLSGRSVRTGSL